MSFPIVLLGLRRFYIIINIIDHKNVYLHNVNCWAQSKHRFIWGTSCRILCYEVISVTLNHASSDVVIRPFHILVFFNDGLSEKIISISNITDCCYSLWLFLHFIIFLAPHWCKNKFASDYLNSNPCHNHLKSEVKCTDTNTDSSVQGKGLTEWLN